MVLSLKRSPLFLAAVGSLLMVLPACKNGETTDGSTTQPDTQPAMGVFNDTCPGSGRAVSADVETTSYKSGSIGFCSPACIEAWKEMSDEDKAAFVAKQDK